MKLYLRLAWRNVWRHRRRTLIIILAMGLTLSMMMMYDGLIVGFNQAIYGNAIKVLGGNIQIHAPGYREKASQTPLLPLANDQAVVEAAEANPLVQVATRRINTGGLITSPEGAFAVGIIGIEPEKEAEANITAQNVKAGRFLAPDDGDVIFIGKGLAEAMGAQVGDRIALFLANRKSLVFVQFRVGVLEVVFFLPFVRGFRVPFQAQTIGVGMVVLGMVVG